MRAALRARLPGFRSTPPRASMPLPTNPFGSAPPPQGRQALRSCLTTSMPTPTASPPCGHRLIPGAPRADFKRTKRCRWVWRFGWPYSVATLWARACRLRSRRLKWNLFDARPLFHLTRRLTPAALARIGFARKTKLFQLVLATVSCLRYPGEWSMR